MFFQFKDPPHPPGISAAPGRVAAKGASWGRSFPRSSRLVFLLSEFVFSGMRKPKTIGGRSKLRVKSKRPFPGIACSLTLCVLLLVPAASASWGEPAPRESAWIVAIDAGHCAENPGAYSARGVGEYTFNSIISSIVLDKLKKNSRIDPVLINSGGEKICLARRVDLINQAKPDLFVSIHQDSVQPVFLTEWIWKGKSAYYCDRYSGFSVFYSGKNEKSAESLRLALLLGQALLEEGFLPSLHHAEKIKGENRQIIDKKRGVYRFDDLAVLKSAKCPGVLLECGIIKNRRDELLLLSYPHQLKISAAIMKALLEFTAEFEQSR